MRILYIDTSSYGVRVILWDNNSCFQLSEKTEITSSNVLIFISEIFKNTSFAIADCDMFAYMCGPGSFTGLRIASIIMQTLNLHYQKPVIAISKLRFIAHSIIHQTSDYHYNRVIVLLDALKGELYCGDYIVKENNIISSNHECLLTDLTKLQFNDFSTQSICVISDVSDKIKQNDYIKNITNITMLNYEDLSYNNCSDCLLRLILHDYNNGYTIQGTSILPTYLKTPHIINYVKKHE